MHARRYFAIAFFLNDIANGANVEIYLKYLFKKIPGEHNLSNEYLETLMPWSKDYREYEINQRNQNLKRYKTLFPMPEIPRTPRKNGNILSIETEKSTPPPQYKSEAI